MSHIKINVLISNYSLVIDIAKYVHKFRAAILYSITALELQNLVASAYMHHQLYSESLHFAQVMYSWGHSRVITHFLHDRAN